MSFIACLMLRITLGCMIGSATGWVAAQQPLAEMRTGDVVVADGVRIHYVQSGDRTAASTLLLVPGWATSSAIWRDQMAALAPLARVVAIDPRSQGDSTVATSGNTPEVRARDVRGVIDELGLTRVVLVGWSQGVQDVAAYAAAFRGAGISGYVLVDTAVAAGPGTAIRRPDVLEQQLRRMALYSLYPKEYLRGMMEAIIRSPEGRARIDEYVAIGLKTPPDIGIGMLLMDFLATDRRDTLIAFNRPTLVIAAASSGELQDQREMAQRIAGARFVTIEDAGHAVFLDQPTRFGGLLGEFIRQVQAAASK